MARRQPAGVFFELPEALPRGQHGLTREQVKAVQRERLLRSFTEQLADVGYAQVKVADVCERAGVSHATFYDLFGNKEECVCAAYERYIDVVTRTAAAKGVNESPSWRAFIEISLDAYFDVLVADPYIGRGFHVDMHAIGGEAGRRQAAALRAFAIGRMVNERRLRERDELLLERPFSVHLGTVQVQRALAREALERAKRPDFAPLRNELLDWFVSSWYGPAEPAGRVSPPASN
jgi:AcrR family transcriptional regulator